jgi:CheY-like chemotaxis protein
MPATRVLIVDDNADLRNLYAFYLRHEGMEAETVSDGETAVKKAIEMLPDVIVMDIVMPAISGIDAIRQLRLDARTNKIPVIAITGAPLQETKQAAFDLRCASFLTKPCLPQRLATEIADILHR